jgi:hypothetical protein
MRPGADLFCASWSSPCRTLVRRSPNRLLHRVCALAFLGALLPAVHGHAADKVTAAVFVKDALALPNRSVTVEAKLLSKGLLSLSDRGLGGEPLELVMHDRVVATAMTGGDGKAVFTYRPKTLGIVPVQVRVGDSPRVAPAEGTANLVVWELRNPIMAVEMASLIEEPSAQSPLPGIGLMAGTVSRPMPDAVEELGKLTEFYYRVLYVIAAPQGADGFQTSREAREWLQSQKFPTGYVLVLPARESALGEKIDELRAAGWTTIKTGIGRTKPFAEAFLQRRLEALLVPVPKKGDIPRKAKVAKDWKEVRKQLQ